MGPQSLTPATFARLMERVAVVSQTLGRPLHPKGRGLAPLTRKGKASAKP